jgi:hypothetical protein
VLEKLLDNATLLQLVYLDHGRESWKW